MTATHEVVRIAVDALRPHPRNYRSHPEDQLAHIEQSLRLHGFYRNIVIARDGTILAGHGVALAARRIGLEEVPVIRLDVDPDEPRALQVLTGDNEIANLGGIDDRELTELLRDLTADDDWDALLGTGFDQQQLAALLLVTRPAHEIPDANAAAEWVGMPDFQTGDQRWQLVVSFASTDDRQRFIDEHNFQCTYTGVERTAWSMSWPYAERRDQKAVEYQ